jgi:hypothetical protein
MNDTVPVTASSTDYLVQRAGANQPWKTVCTNKSLEYAETVYGKQLGMASYGRFRLVAPDGKVLKEEQASLFSKN